MAGSEPISWSQIGKPNLLDPLKKELEEVNTLLDTTGETLKKVISESANIAKQTPLSSFDNLEKVEKSLKDAKKAVAELEKIERIRVKTLARVKELDAGIAASSKKNAQAILAQAKALKAAKGEGDKMLNSYEKLVKSQKESEKELLRLTTVFGENSDEVKEAKKEYLSLTEQVNKINAVRKEEAVQISTVQKLQSKLNSLTDDSVKTEFELKEQIRLQTKELRDAAKAAAESEDSYKVLVRSTNEAQARFKTLAAQFGATSKQAKKAGKEFDALDKKLRKINEDAKDGRRDVGRYEKGVAKLEKTFNRVAKATLVLKVLELMQNAFSANSDGAAELEKVVVRLTTTITVFVSRLVDALPIMQAKFEEFILSVRIGILEATSWFGDNDDALKSLRKQYESISDVAKKDVSSAFKGMQQEIVELIDKKVQLIDDTLKYRKEIVSLENDINKLLPAQAKLRAQTEDDSASIEEQITARLAYRESLKSVFAIEERIAARRLKLAQDGAAANKDSVEAQEELSAASREYTELIAGQTEEIAANEKEINKLRSDATELNLDFYVDDAQNRIDTNQRIIDDETQTFARRRALIVENDKEREKANQLRADALNETLRRMGKAELDFESLRKSTSSEDIARQVRESGLSEQLAIRALEILRERRTELQDSEEAQRDLNEAEAESLRLQDDIALQEEALLKLKKRGVNLEKVLQALGEARLQSEIDNLQKRLAAAEKGSEEYIALNQELNDKLLQQDQNRINKQIKKLSDLGKASQEAFSLLGDIAQERSQKRVEAIEEELEAEEGRLEKLRELAAQGNEDAQNNIAITEQRQAQLELEREKQLARQKKSELALTAIQTYSGKVTSGEPNPLASTISDIAVLRAFVNTLPGFFEGTEDTGDKGVLSDKHGAITGFTHEHERVISAEHNKLIGDMSNAELARLAHKEKVKQSGGISADEIVKELREIRKATQDKPVYLGADVDEIAGYLTRKVKTGQKLERIHTKTGGIWGK